MNEYRIKTSFFKLSFFFTIGFISFSAWSFNSMCHSPVQLAALMSPNKPNLSKGEKIRKRIKALEKKKEEYENKLDDVEGDLGDSLSKEKLKDDPYSVAGSVQSYIENNQSGWSCAEASSGGSYTRKFIIKENLLLKINVWELIILSAYAQEDPPPPPQSAGIGSGNKIKAGKKTNNSVSQSAPKRTGNKSDPCPDRNNEGECICSDNQGWENDRCVPCSSKPGGKWSWVAGASKPCVCNQGKNIVLDGEKCREKTCKEKGMVNLNGGCISKADNYCRNAGGSLDESGKCICPATHGLENGKCVQCSSKPGKKWTPGATIGESCQCDTKQNPNLIKKGKECREKTCEERGMIKTTDNGCKTEKEVCELQIEKEWIGEECKDTPKTTCEKQEGKEWKNGSCQYTPEAECKNRGGKWQYSKSGGCSCPSPYVEEVKDGNTVCRDKNKSERCRDKGGNWSSQDSRCACPSNHKAENGNCVQQTAQDLCEDQEGKSFINGECVDCPDWKKHGSFRENGKVDSSFCNAYAQDQRTCKNALARLGRLVSRLEQYNKSIGKLEEKLWSLNDSEDTKTEAGGLCFDCLKRELKANRPTVNQTIGNLANIIAGAGFGFAGYKAGQNAQSHANMLRIQQGYPASNDYYALQGATAGYPFIANGLYGMTRVNTPVGGWACTPSVNPYGHTYSQNQGYGYQMPYY